MGATFVIVMGVSGSGKSTLAAALAREYNLALYDADDLHSPSNVEKMSRGEPLSDADREPWLELVRTTAAHAMWGLGTAGRRRQRGVVVACSALKRYYRDILRGTHNTSTAATPADSGGGGVVPLPPAYFVYISGSRELLRERMGARRGHFMNISMLDSQLQTLESPEGEQGVIVVDLEDSTEEQMRKVKERLPALAEGGLAPPSARDTSVT